MGTKIAKIILIIFLSTGLCASSAAQELTGSIKGTVTDAEGGALPGASVMVTSESLMGTKTYVTTGKGAFRFPALPPGKFILTVEMPGFKAITRENIIIRVGMVVTLNITMEMAAIEEEITVTAVSPIVDVKQSKISVIMDEDLLKDIPMARDLYDIVNVAPGAVFEGSEFQKSASFRRTTSIHGGTMRSNTTAFDGVNMNDPVVMYPLTNINFDVMEEVEMETAGHPASVGYTDGAYVNIVTRSGGNKFSGGATIYYTNNDLSQSLWTDEQVKAFGVSQPGVDKSWIDGSLTFGGPILTDKLWFFSNARYIKQEQLVSYVPWTDILGRFHDKYDWSNTEMMGFIKLTSQLTKKIKLVGMFNYVDRYRPMYESPGPRINFIATRVLDHEKAYTGNSILSCILDQNTFFDLRVGYVHRWFPLPMQAEAQGLPSVNDVADNYDPLTTAPYNETYIRKRFQSGLYFTRFQDNLFGGNHEFKGGLEFEDAYGDWDVWREDNLFWRWSGSPYYFGGNFGLVAFETCGPEEGSSKMINRGKRIGAFIQDSVTFADRLTLSVGVRFDRSWAWFPALTKAASGNPLSVWIGENVVRPYVAGTYPEEFPDGLNPWAEATTDEWKSAVVWNTFSPRFGLTFDLFGDGKTALKASFASYSEYLMLSYFTMLHPFYPRVFTFMWIDTDLNGQVDQTDSFRRFPEDYRVVDLEFAGLKIDPDTKSPITDEFTLGLWHELFKNFSLGFNFIYKNKKNIIEDALYSPDTDEYWYHFNQEPAQRYWISFPTTVPSDVYGDKDVTFYVLRNEPDAPPIFYRTTNVPELKRKYWALELLFNKRMAGGWQFAGSVVFSKAYGNIGGWYLESAGWTGAGDSPNDFVNSYGRTSIDRPLQIKLMGTVELPLSIFLSTYYRFFSGSPWARSASIRPPSSWTTPRNALRDYYDVLLEAPGTRRNRFWNNLDLRLEKEFRIGDLGRLGAYVDVFNLLGWSGVEVGQNDVYRWDPDDEGYGESGSLTVDPDYQYISSVSGIRQIKLSIRFSF